MVNVETAAVKVTISEATGVGLLEHWWLDDPEGLAWDNTISRLYEVGWELSNEWEDPLSLPGDLLLYPLRKVTHDDSQ